MKKIPLIVLLLLLIISPKLHAAGSIGVSGATFLEIGVGSRPLGMGEAFTAGTDDINTIYYNPAGLATLRYPLLSVHHQELILDSRFENVSFAHPLFGGILGLSHSIFWVPSFDKIDIDGNKTGQVKFVNGVMNIAYAYDLNFMYVGGTVKYVYQKIDTLFVNSFAFDIGVLKGMYLISPFDAPVRNFYLGMSLQNIGTPARSNPLPRIMRMGASYRMTHWMTLNLDVTENFIVASDLYDFIYGFDESFRVNTGVEFTYLDLVSLRAGYRFNDAGGFSAGLGFNYVIDNVSFTIDASFSDAGIFGPVYSLGVSFKLIPKVITIEDRIEAENHYKKAIKLFIANDFDGALQEFELCREANPYHKNIDGKINDIKEILELRKQNEELDEELKKLKRN